MNGYYLMQNYINVFIIPILFILLVLWLAEKGKKKAKQINV
jgi:hypothetical protein